MATAFGCTDSRFIASCAFDRRKQLSRRVEMCHPCRDLSPTCCGSYPLRLLRHVVVRMHHITTTGRCSKVAGSRRPTTCRKIVVVSIRQVALGPRRSKASRSRPVDHRRRPLRSYAVGPSWCICEELRMACSSDSLTSRGDCSRFGVHHADEPRRLRVDVWKNFSVEQTTSSRARPRGRCAYTTAVNLPSRTPAKPTVTSTIDRGPASSSSYPDEHGSLAPFRPAACSRRGVRKFGETDGLALPYV